MSCLHITCTDLPLKPFNGKKCFTCNATADCTRTMACEGDETQCFITTGEPFIIIINNNNNPYFYLNLYIDRMSVIISFYLGL